MTKTKRFAAVAIIGSLGVAGFSVAGVNGNGSDFTEQNKEQDSFCALVPFACASTQSNGGGKDPEKPKPDDNN